MEFREAFTLLKAGFKIKLPSWGGYWFWDGKAETIVMHTKNNEDIDIRDTKDPDYTFSNIASNEWIVATEENTPTLGGQNYLPFGTAIRLVKKGLKLSRKGWNGKNQYIELATDISYTNAKGEVINVKHDAIGSKAIAFVGTTGVQMGWLASQADLLADDWYIVQ